MFLLDLNFSKLSPSLLSDIIAEISAHLDGGPYSHVYLFCIILLIKFYPVFVLKIQDTG
jgi:hypothetical protein